jgi:hypothetical protein
MTTKEVAAGLVALCKEGKFSEAIEAYYGEGIVSVEAFGPEGADLEMTGLDAIRGKSAWWSQNMEVTSIAVEGPFVNGDQFTVLFRLDVVQKADGKAFHMEEIALYTLESGKIIREVFFG